MKGGGRRGKRQGLSILHTCHDSNTPVLYFRMLGTDTQHKRCVMICSTSVAMTLILRVPCKSRTKTREFEHIQLGQDSFIMNKPCLLGFRV